MQLNALDPARRITQYALKIWDMEEGLPDNAVFAVSQTEDGYMWFGTRDGLAQFNGATFRLFSNSDMNQTKASSIRTLFQDRQGRLWIGTAGSGLTFYQQGRFKTFPVNSHKFLSNIFSIIEDENGGLWIGSNGHGLSHFRNDTFTVYTAKDGLPHNHILKLRRDDKGNIWVTTKGGVVSFKKPGEWELFPGSDTLGESIVDSLYDEGQRILWVGTGYRGLYGFGPKKPLHYGANRLGYPTVNCLYLDSDANLWIGKDREGLTRLKDGKLSSLTTENGLADGSVYAIYEDREKSLWVGTINGGVHQLRNTKFVTFTKQDNLVHSDIQCVIQGKNNNDLWIGTKGGLCRMKPDGSDVETVLTKKKGLLDNSVVSLHEDASETLWIGTYGGLQLYSRGSLKSNYTEKQGLTHKYVKCITEDSSGNTWVGTEKGLNLFQKPGSSILQFNRKEGPFSTAIEFIFEDSRGYLWIGTDNGLSLMKDSKILQADLNKSGKQITFQCAYEDSEGRMWFGTYNGLYLLKGNDLFHFPDAGRFVSNYIYSILGDTDDYFWFGGRNGIFRIKKSDLTGYAEDQSVRLSLDWYNESDGMKTRWCTGSAIDTRDGRFWFPTSDGLTMFHPTDIPTNTVLPPVVIEKLIVDEETIPIHNNPEQKETGPLAAGTKRFEFHYNAFSFINPREVKFKVKLEGYDENWIDMSNVRGTTYTELPPGQYTFKVKACNSDGVWNEEGTSFSFYLNPFFYETLWFMGLMGLVILLTIIFSHRFRVRNLEKKRAELALLVDERTRDLQARNRDLEKARQKIQHSKEMIEDKNIQLESQTLQLKDQAEKLKEMDKIKSRFFANISHEFRTPLTLIMGPLEQMIEESPEESNRKRLNLMWRNSRRLLSLIDQLLELARFESGQIKLQAHRVDIIPFLKGMVTNFSPLADRNELEMIFSSDISTLPVYADTEKLEHILGNLLINAIKFTPPGGRVILWVEKVEAGENANTGIDYGSVRIIVEDTGPGIPRDQLPHIFERFYQTEFTREHNKKGAGIGLALVKELVQVHHGKIDVYSREGKGTRFIVQLPLGDQHLEPGERALPDKIKEIPLPDDIQLTPVSLQDPVDENVEDNPVDCEVDTKDKEIILVVEDSAEVRDYIRGTLEPEYHVEEAGDGEVGITQAMKLIPDLILCDVMMPRQNGYQLCQTLKNDIKTSHIPIVMLTAKAEEEHMIMGLETGADDYVTKPFNTKVLLARIRNLIEIRRQFHFRMHREMTLQPAEMKTSSLDKAFMKQLKSMILKNLADPEFNVEELARQLNLDRSTVYRKVLALTGESPTEFIRSCRLKRGAELLKKNYGSIIEVAFEVGFASANYFTKCFKKKFHQLPSQYTDTSPPF